MPRFQHQTGIVPAYLRPICSHVYGMPAAGEEGGRRISHSGQNHPQETFPPGQSGSCSAFFISVFHALFSCLQSRFLLFFCQIEVHLREGVSGFRNSRACCAATVPRGKMALRQDCLLLFILFFFCSLPGNGLCRHGTGGDIRPLPDTDILALPLVREQHA